MPSAYTIYVSVAMEGEVRSRSTWEIKPLEALGMSLADFFSQEDTNEKVVFGADDVFVKEDEDAGHSIHWLIPNAQKNSLEPILVTLQSGGKTWEQDPHCLLYTSRKALHGS